MESHEPRPRGGNDQDDERYARLMDEVEVVAAVLEDLDSEELQGRITMWLDYMIYRALYDGGEPAECATESRECRRLLMAHLDAVAWA